MQLMASAVTAARGLPEVTQRPVVAKRPAHNPKERAKSPAVRDSFSKIKAPAKG